MGNIFVSISVIFPSFVISYLFLYLFLWYSINKKAKDGVYCKMYPLNMQDYEGCGRLDASVFVVISATKDAKNIFFCFLC